MKALGFKKHGEFDVMELLDLPKPTPGPGEVLIDIKASAFNHLDIWIRKGWPGLDLELPHVSGSDAAGIIAEVGEGVDTFAIGDRVALDPGVNLCEDEYTQKGEPSVSPGFKIIGEDRRGTHAEYIAVPANNCVALPESISFETAAAAGLVCVTAWRMLMKRANIQAGEKVLVLGAGGGLNSISIQIAKAQGCNVYAITSTEEKMQQAKQLGADVVLNYKENKDWAKELFALTNKEGFDVIVDNVGAATLNASMRLAKRGGRIVIVGNTSGPTVEIDIRLIFGKQLNILGSTMGSHQDYIDAMQWVFDGAITPPIYKALPLGDGIEGMGIMEAGQQFGKIVLTQA